MSRAKLNNPEDYLVAVDRALKTGDSEVAGRFLDEGERLFPDNGAIFIRNTYFMMPHAPHDAAARWAIARDRFPSFPDGWIHGATCAVSHDEAEAFLAEALRLFPDRLPVLLKWGHQAEARSDWQEATRRWRVVLSRYPDNKEASVRHQVCVARAEETLAADGRFAEAHTVSHDETELLNSDKHAQLLLRFESLGENCHFGIVQSRFSAEPLALLRFTSTPLRSLIEALNERFFGVGEPENTSIEVLEDKYVTRNKRYNMVMYTFQSVKSQSDAVVVAQRFERRLRYLRQKLIGDLSVGEKILVYTCSQPILPSEPQMLYDALQQYGKNSLLFVSIGGSDTPPGTLIRLGERFFMGYVDSLDNTLPSLPIWARLCQDVLAELTEGPTHRTGEPWAAYQGNASGMVQLSRDPATHLRAAASHRASGDLGAEDEILRQATKLFPSEPQVLMSFAWNAIDRHNWADAVERWKAFRAVSPDVAAGYFGASIALRGLELFDEADALLFEGMRRVPDHAEIRGNYAWNAHVRKDWPEAHRRWVNYHDQFPDDPIGYSSLGVVLRELGRFDEANSILAEGLSRFPDHRDLIVNSAWVSYFSGDWPEALQRWTRYRDRFPDDPLGHRQVMLVLGELGQFEELEHLSARPAADDLKDPAAAKLMFSFESLGDNCEFGVVQRHFGAEPLGLLRFTSTPPNLLKAALEQQFAGVGDPENTGLRDVHGEYMTYDSRFHMSMHTFIRTMGDDKGKRLEKICQRIHYLRDKLLNDLRAAEKHFVYHCREQLADDEIRSLWQAMRAYGDNRLLFIYAEAPTQKAGTIRVLEDDLIVGCVDRLSVEKPSFDIWRRLCEQAHDIWLS